MLSVCRLLIQRQPTQMKACALVRSEWNATLQLLRPNLPALSSSNWTSERWRSTTTVGWPMQRQYNYLDYSRLPSSKNHLAAGTPVVPTHGFATKISDTKTTNQSVDKKAEEDTSVDATETTEKLGLVAKFKLMFKNYWYVLVPVHCVTSIAWFSGFYYLSSR